MRNIFLIWTSGSGVDVNRVFFSNFSSGGHFVQWNGIFYAIFWFSFVLWSVNLPTPFLGKLNLSSLPVICAYTFACKLQQLFL